MKNWTDRQIFFIFDTEFCQNEEDDPKDAIIYFFPQETSDSIRCTMCCQLMGIAQFLQFSFSPVSLIRLHKGKFATKSIGKYTLALNGSHEMPDSVLQNQLARLVQLFVFHFKNFDTVQLASCGSRRVFLEKMSSIWCVLLSVSQCAYNILDLVLNVLPSIELPKRAGALHLQAAQFLEASQCHKTVIAGCIMFHERIFYSQLPMSILHNLMFIFNSNKQSLPPPGEIVPVEFEIPGGVHLTYVYLSCAEVTALSRIFNKFHFLQQTFLNFRTPGIVSNESYLLSDPNGQNQEIINAEQLLFTYDNSLDCYEMCENHDVKLEVTDPNNPPSDGVSDIPSSYESCADSAVHLNQAVEVIFPVKSNFISTNTVSANNNVNDSKEVGITEKTSFVKNEIPPYSCGSDPEIDYSSSPSDRNHFKNDNHTHRCVLYIQSYNDYKLIFILDTTAEKNAYLIHSLWKLGLTSLRALERDVKHCFEITPLKVSKEKSKYIFLQYDQKWHTSKGNVSSFKDSIFSRQLFNGGVELLHDEFAESSHLHEITLRLKDVIVYGHQMSSKETFYQTSTSYSKDVGFPHVADAMADISVITKRRIEKEQKIILL